MKNAGRGLLMMGFAAALLTACGEDDVVKTIPIVTTLEAAEVSTTTAALSGVIEATGHAKITESGFVYSVVKENPTLADNKKAVTAVGGDLSTVLSGLNSGTTYHVRAYATNSEGTGYGDAIHFTTGNAAPVATGVTIAFTGELKIGTELTASYNYTDAEGDGEEGTIIQWYRADTGAGAGEVPIDGANSLNYTLQDEDGEKYIRVGITPKATSGTTEGIEQKSLFTNEVGGITEVTFTYNNQQVTYGIITSSVTGRKWLDRNLGAANTPTAYNDWANYGDLFQWGRLDDGHQVVTYSGPNPSDATGSAENTPFGGENPILSNSDDPGHNLFIPNNNSTAGTPSGSYDWRTPQNDNLWQGAEGVNNPCPTGWRIPSIQEWQAEGLSTIVAAYEQLKLTASGLRFTYGRFDYQSLSGSYWSSTIVVGADGIIKGSNAISVGSTSSKVIKIARAYGQSCRCIKHE